MTTQPQARFFTLRSLKAGLYVLFISALLTSACTLTASAQSVHNPEATMASAENEVTAAELAEMLTSPIAEERDRAFQQVTDFAYRRPEIDLGPTVPVLVEIYKNDPEKKYRLAAISALYAIGDESGLEQVRQRFLQEPSLHVQYVSLQVLVDHYGPEAFAGNPEAVALAKNILARTQESQRLAQRPPGTSSVVAKQ